MSKKRRKNKRSRKARKLRNLSVKQQATHTNGVFCRTKNEITQPHNYDQTHEIPPPQFGEQLLHFFLPKEGSDIKIGDLAEHYHKLQPRLGTRKASIWYYKEVGFMLWQQIPRIFKIIFYTWIQEMFRRHV